MSHFFQIHLSIGFVGCERKCISSNGTHHITRTAAGWVLPKPTSDGFTTMYFTLRQKKLARFLLQVRNDRRKIILGDTMCVVYYTLVCKLFECFLSPISSSFLPPKTWLPRIGPLSCKDQKCWSFSYTNNSKDCLELCHCTKK